MHCIHVENSALNSINSLSTSTNANIKLSESATESSSKKFKYIKLVWGLLILSGKDGESIFDAIKNRVIDINSWQQRLFSNDISPTHTIMNQVWYHLADKHAVERKVMELLASLKTVSNENVITVLFECLQHGICAVSKGIFSYLKSLRENLQSENDGSLVCDKGVVSAISDFGDIIAQSSSYSHTMKRTFKAWYNNSENVSLPKKWLSKFKPHSTTRNHRNLQNIGVFQTGLDVVEQFINEIDINNDHGISMRQFLKCTHMVKEMLICKAWEYGYFKPMENYFINSTVSYLYGSIEFVNSWRSMQHTYLVKNGMKCSLLLNGVGAFCSRDILFDNLPKLNDKLKMNFLKRKCVKESVINKDDPNYRHLVLFRFRSKPFDESRLNSWIVTVKTCRIIISCQQMYLSADDDSEYWNRYIYLHGKSIENPLWTKFDDPTILTSHKIFVNKYGVQKFEDILCDTVGMLLDSLHNAVTYSQSRTSTLLPGGDCSNGNLKQMKHHVNGQAVNDETEGTIGRFKHDPIDSKQNKFHTSEGNTLLRLNGAFDGLRELKSVNKELYDRCLIELKKLTLRTLERELNEANALIEKEIYIRRTEKAKEDKRRIMVRKQRMDLITIFDSYAELESCLDNLNTKEQKYKILSQQCNKIKYILKANDQLEDHIKIKIGKTLQVSMNSKKRSLDTLKKAHRLYLDCNSKNDFSYYEDLALDTREVMKCVLSCHKLTKYLNNSNKLLCTNGLCKKDYTGNTYWKCTTKNCAKRDNICNGCVMAEKFIDNVKKCEIGEKRVFEDIINSTDTAPQYKRRKLTPVERRHRQQLFRHLQANRIEYTIQLLP